MTRVMSKCGADDVSAQQRTAQNWQVWLNSLLINDGNSVLCNRPDLIISSNRTQSLSNPFTKLNSIIEEGYYQLELNCSSYVEMTQLLFDAQMKNRRRPNRNLEKIDKIE